MPTWSATPASNAAAIKAAEAVDVALGRLTMAIVAAGGEMLISADHGNLEQMLDANGVPHTQHTVGPVPLVYVGRKATLAARRAARSRADRARADGSAASRPR